MVTSYTSFSTSMSSGTDGNDPPATDAPPAKRPRTVPPSESDARVERQLEDPAAAPTNTPTETTTTTTTTATTTDTPATPAAPAAQTNNATTTATTTTATTTTTPSNTNRYGWVLGDEGETTNPLDKPNLCTYVAAEIAPRVAGQKRKRNKAKWASVEESMKEGILETSYTFDRGLRRVVPYTYRFDTFAKKRWEGRQILEVFTAEFRGHDQAYYENALAVGRITVNGNKVDPTYVIKLKDCIAHYTHRHEPPVSDEHPGLIDMSEHIIVVNKPASIPVHPCGRYRHNSIPFILGHEHGIFDVYQIHRLDRLTSGILLVARSAPVASVLATAISDRTLKKTYLARVVGEFPAGETVTVDQPIEVIRGPDGRNSVAEGGKPSKTLFERISYNGRSSVVRCLPVSGRTHQIRVHLSWLGFPIVNDPLYNDRNYFADKRVAKRKRSDSESETPAVVGGADSVDAKEGDDGGDGGAGGSGESVGLGTSATTTTAEATGAATTAGTDSDKDVAMSDAAKSTDDAQESGDSGDNDTSEYWPPLDPASVDKNCPECAKGGWPDPKPSEMALWLHALSYEGEHWFQAVPEPVWAADDFDCSAGM